MGMTVFQPRDTERARTLRKAATPAERHLWRYLSARQLGGYKFSRQMPVGPYFADFLCREEKLIVELDGISHDGQLDRDAARSSYLVGQGFRVVRFSNEDALRRTEGVLIKIAEALARRPTPDPSRKREGGTPP